jgi:hypothetical protein
MNFIMIVGGYALPQSISIREMTLVTAARPARASRIALLSPFTRQVTVSIHVH